MEIDFELQYTLKNLLPEVVLIQEHEKETMNRVHITFTPPTMYPTISNLAAQQIDVGQWRQRRAGLVLAGCW